MTTPISAFNDRLPADTLLNTGMLFVGNSPLSASQGGVSFDPGNTFRQTPYDGQLADRETLDRKVYSKPTIAGSFLQFAHRVWFKYENGGSPQTVGYPAVVPKPIGEFYASGDYLGPLRLIYQRGSGGLVEVVFLIALCAKYDIKGNDKGEALVNATFEAKLSADAEEGTAPYYIKEIPSVS